MPPHLQHFISDKISDFYSNTVFQLLFNLSYLLHFPTAPGRQLCSILQLHTGIQKRLPKYFTNHHGENTHRYTGGFIVVVPIVITVDCLLIWNVPLPVGVENVNPLASRLKQKLCFSSGCINCLGLQSHSGPGLEISVSLWPIPMMHVHWDGSA